MTFEEEFPSLKGKQCSPLKWRKIENIPDDDLCEASLLDYQKEVTLHHIKVLEFEVYSEDDVQKHCLDKQRVKEAMTKIREKLGKKHTGMRLFETLMKEDLGLE